jgi:hypothetical protein
VSNYDEDLASLEDWLRRLKVEYDIFFNGHRKKPPEDLRLRLEKLVKKLSESSGMSFAQRFKYNTLIGRYYIYRDLWRRMLAEQESGIEAKGPIQSAGARQNSGRKESALKETRVSIADPQADQDEVHRLYDALIRLRGSAAGAPPAMPYSQFADYIAGQTRKIKEKAGCASVQFILSMEGDAIKFTARPEKNP